jgi:hypothetical protein
MLDQIGHLPQDDEEVSFIYNQAQFKALVIKNQLFVKIEVTLNAIGDERG